MLAYPLALAGAIFFGVGNFILALVGYEEGIKTFYPQCIGATILFLGYHGGAWIVNIFQGNSPMAYFSAENSAYYNEEALFTFG